MSSKESLECICNICDHDCGPYIHYDKSRCVFYGVIRKDLDQLEEYRKIEEEIGIDLITLFEALKNGIFVAYDSSFGMANKPKIKITKDTATGICYRNKKWYIQEDETLIKDYGKTWSLDKNFNERGIRK